MKFLLQFFPMKKILENFCINCFGDNHNFNKSKFITFYYTVKFTIHIKFLFIENN